jgi:hypothetical protein
MRRRRGTASTGTRSRKPLANKGHRTPASGRRSGHQSTHAFKQLKRALDEARQQQTAAADVLKVISGSAFDLKLVLETLIKSATRLCGATRGHILQFNGEFLIFGRSRSVSRIYGISCSSPFPAWPRHGRRKGGARSPDSPCA